MTTSVPKADLLLDGLALVSSIVDERRADFEALMAEDARYASAAMAATTHWLLRERVAEKMQNPDEMFALGSQAVAIWVQGNLIGRPLAPLAAADLHAAVDIIMNTDSHDPTLPPANRVDAILSLAVELLKSEGGEPPIAEELARFRRQLAV